MEKVYRLLDRIDADQAIDWLKRLTQTDLDYRALCELCNAGHCRMYLDCRGVEVNDSDGNLKYQLISDMAPITGTINWGISDFGELYVYSVNVKSDAWDMSDSDFGEAVLDKAFTTNARRVPLFKPAEIEALGAKINGSAEHIAEIETLRQELEQEREARQVIESELRERRAKDANAGLDSIRQALSRTPAEFAAMQKRAEDAERMIAALDHQLTEQTEEKNRNDAVFREMARQLKELQDNQRAVPVPKPDASGLIFPYPTKQLEVMLAAALKYWADYTPDKRLPTQKEVGIDIGEALGLPRQGNGDAARKAIELASAIKPDALPDA